MINNKKKKFTLFGKLVIFGFLLFIVLIVFFIFFNKDNNITLSNTFDELNITDVNNVEDDIKENDLVKSVIDFEIIDSSESDTDNIKEYFSDGLSVEDFKKILEKQSVYLNSDGTYSEINYNFDSKLHYSEIEEIIKKLDYSDIVNVEIIGQSVDGRNLYGIEIGKGDRVLYIDANLHAAEVANTPMLIKFMSELVNSYESGDNDIVNKLNDIKLAIVPCLNPDGYEVYNFGVDSLNDKTLWWYVNRDSIDFENLKSNANGVDLNRSFPSQNGGLYFKSESLYKTVSFTKSTNRYKYFPGDSLGSEPETKASMYFMLKHHKNIFAYVDMHSQGRVMYAGKPNLADEFNDLTLSFAKWVSSYNNYKVHGLSSEEVGEGCDGSATDFMAEVACGFKFSSVTGRLSTDKYVNNSSTLVYSYPVITLETINTYTTDVSVFKNEYYNKGIKNTLYALLDYKN